MTVETTTGQRVRIINVSKGGLMVESRSPAAVGAELVLTTRGHILTVTLPVRVVHSVRVTSDHKTVFLLNMEFTVPLDEGQMEVVRRWLSGR